MSLQTWQETIANQKGAAGSFTAYTTAKTVIDPTALVTLPANYLEAGKRFRITVLGGISNIVTAQPTFTFQVMMGSIVVHTSGAILTTTTAHVLIPFKYVVDLRVDTVGNGTTAKFLGQGVLEGIMFVISGAVGDPTAGIGKIMASSAAIVSVFVEAVSNLKVKDYVVA